MANTVARERSAGYRWVVLGVLFLAQLTGSMALYVIAALAPVIQSELRLSNTEIGVFSASALAGAWSVLLVIGSLTDRFGARRMVVLGTLSSGVVLLAMPLAGHYMQATALMFAAGVMLGMTTPGMSKAVLEWFPAESRATAMSLKHSATPLAGVFIASVLPSVALAFGWRSAIAIVGLMAIGAGVATAALFRDARPAERQRGGGPGMRAVLGTVLRDRKVWGISMLAFTFLVVQGGVVTYLALYLKHVVLVPSIPDERARIVAAGGFLALCQAGGVVGRVSWGVISDRVFKGRRMVVMLIIGGVAGLMSLVYAFLPVGPPLWLLAAMVFVQGATVLGWNGLYHTLIVETAGRTQAATAIGLSMTVSQGGQVMGAPLLGLVIDVAGSYQPTWLVMSLMSAIGGTIAVAHAREERRTG